MVPAQQHIFSTVVAFVFSQAVSLLPNNEQT